DQITQPGTYAVEFQAMSAADDVLIRSPSLEFNAAIPTQPAPQFDHWSTTTETIPDIPGRGIIIGSVLVPGFPAVDALTTLEMLRITPNDPFEIRVIDTISQVTFARTTAGQPRWSNEAGDAVSGIWLNVDTIRKNRSGPVAVQVRTFSYGDEATNTWILSSGWSTPQIVSFDTQPAMVGSRQAANSLTHPLLTWTKSASLKLGNLRGYQSSISDQPLVKPNYEVWVTDATTKKVVVHEMDVGINSFELPASLQAGRYYAWIRAHYEDDVVAPSEWSPVHVVTIKAPAVDEIQTGGATADATPVISWPEVTGVRDYEIWIQEDGVSRPAYRRSGLTATRHRVELPLQAGQYRVWIRAHLKTGADTLWGAGMPLVIGPAARVSTNGTVVSWTSIADATEYELWVDRVDDAGRTLQSRVVHRDGLYGQSVTLKLASGRYRVWIRAIRSEAGMRYLSRWSVPATLFTESV
ncbi:MAG: hypothetical protein KDA96_17105, partial [Planctomycetaceae bacterium]|nr:hypothetical protein [Planctomycetaceae bacterium]